MQNLLLLHGAMGAAVQLQPLQAALAQQYTVHTFNFQGHGGQPLPAHPFSIDEFAQQAQLYIESRCNNQPVFIFGYSMGGYVAMRLAQLRPQLIIKVVTLATKYYWDAATAAKEVQMLQPEAVETKVPKFAERLAQLHGANNWKPLMRYTAALLQSLGQHNILEAAGYQHIETPALLMTGDRDTMATAEETTAVYRRLPAAQLAILPGTPHPLEKTDTRLLAVLSGNFFG